MALPEQARSFHTVWISIENKAIATRYALYEGEMFCFADGPLGSLNTGDRIDARIHAIADGPPLFWFSATVRRVEPRSETPLHVVADVAGNSPLFKKDVENPYADMRSWRPMIALV